MQNLNSSLNAEKSSTFDSTSGFIVGQRVHFAGDHRRIGTVKYVGPVEGYSGTWIGVDWDNADGKHDGSINGIRYFEAESEKSGSFVRPQNLSFGVSLLDGLELRYRGSSTKEEEEEMYVLSASNRRVSIELVGKEKLEDKLSRFEELTVASLSYLGVSYLGPTCQIRSVMPNLKELDLTGNLLSDWKDIGNICEELPTLRALNLTNNKMASVMTGLPLLKNIRILVLNNTGIQWAEVEILKLSLPMIEELHLMCNKISAITPKYTSAVQGFSSLKLLNMEDNCISDWVEIVKLFLLESLEQLHLNKNSLTRICYPDEDMLCDLLSNCESTEKSIKPFNNLRCLLLGGNKIEDLASVDSLNSFPKLTVRFYN